MAGADAQVGVASSVLMNQSSSIFHVSYVAHRYLWGAKQHIGSCCKPAKCHFQSLAFMPIVTISVRQRDVSISAVCHSLSRQADKEHVFQIELGKRLHGRPSGCNLLLL